MVETVLAINSGSSSLKAALIRKDGKKMAKFLAEQLGTESAKLHSYVFVPGEDEKEQSIPHFQHEQALEKILDLLKDHDLMQSLVGTGHRVVHGGMQFSDSALVNSEEILGNIQQASNLAPLHNPHNVSGIQALRRIAPDLPVVAVFDTSFHQTMPDKASLYPLPKSYRDRGIRKYGFHGTSVRFVADRAGKLIGNCDANMIVCHLGNGASITAVANQQSVETSMGFSPLEGLMMGTRSGSIDPAVVSFAVHALDKSADDVLNDLNKNSGLKAMANGESDMRHILCDAKKGSKQAQLALDMFVYRVVQHIAMCAVALPNLADAIVFTGGIGEHSADVRRDCMRLMRQTIYPNLEIHEEWNRQDGSHSEGFLTEKSSTPICLEVATDEEVMIARDCFRLIQDDNRKRVDSSKNGL